MQHLLEKREYDFLKNNEHLGKNLILLGVSGSLGYGTGDEQSDIDLRGIALNQKSELIGFDRYEQYEDQETDSVIYTFNKAIKLFLECNPNTIELLGLNPEHYLLLHPIGKDLIARSQMFLSKRAINSFSKYASSQLRRLQNALARDHFPTAQRETHVLQSMKSVLDSLVEKYQISEEQNIDLYWDESINHIIANHKSPNHKEVNLTGANQQTQRELMVDIRLERFPLKSCNHIISEINNVLKTYEKLNKPRSKKDDRHLNKHAMHLIRLFMMAIDILEKGQINTYRGNERELLLKIKRGEFQDEMGNFKSEFFEMVNEYEVRVQRAANNTILPDHPDMKLVEDYVMHINKKVINDEF